MRLIRLSRGLLILAGGWVLYELTAWFFPFLKGISHLELSAAVVWPLAWQSVCQLYPGVAPRETAVAAAAALVFLRLLDFTRWLLPLSLWMQVLPVELLVYLVTLAVIAAAMLVVAGSLLGVKGERAALRRAAGFGLKATGFGVAVGFGSLYYFLVRQGSSPFSRIWRTIAECLSNTVLVVYPVLVLACPCLFFLARHLRKGSPESTPRVPGSSFFSP